MSTPARDESLVQAHQRMVDALRNNDVKTLLSLFASDVVFMPPNEPSIYGQTELAEWWKEYFEYFKITGLGETDRCVTTIEQWAIERWSFQVTIQPLGGGDRIIDEGRLLHVWRSDGEGEWEIVQQIWNSTRPIGSGTSRFMSLLKRRLKIPGVA